MMVKVEDVLDKDLSWSDRASRCPMAEKGFEPYHKWIVVSTIVTPTSRSVSMIMCGVCFHEVNLSEAFGGRVCFRGRSDYESQRGISVPVNFEPPIE